MGTQQGNEIASSNEANQADENSGRKLPALILDEALQHFQLSDQSHKVTYWIKHFSDEPKKLRQRLVERLEANGFVKQEEKRLIWVIPYADSPVENASAKFVLKSRIRKSVLTNEALELHDLALMSLVKACNLLNFVFTKDERKMARQRIYELMVSETLKDPEFQSIDGHRLPSTAVGIFH